MVTFELRLAFVLSATGDTRRLVARPGAGWPWLWAPAYPGHRRRTRRRHRRRRLTARDTDPYLELADQVPAPGARAKRSMTIVVQDARRLYRGQGERGLQLR